MTLDQAQTDVPQWARIVSMLLIMIGAYVYVGAFMVIISILALLAAAVGAGQLAGVVAIPAVVWIMYTLLMRASHHFRTRAMWIIIIASSVPLAAALSTEVPQIVVATIAVHIFLLLARFLERQAQRLDSLWAWRFRRLSRGGCPRCSYSIRGLQSERCPECGATWTLEELNAAVQERLN